MKSTVHREPGEGQLAAIAEGWHLCVLIGLTTPQAALCTDGVGLLLALYSCARGRASTGAALSATVSASATALALLH
ncbi:hypothetical protein ACIQI8_27360 [Streptomyces sp. NPDC092369]|uniref:hypothetical protein n=1 Tax=Streptomyces sp. NPDC092369 TaxID=3366015 RepID=UPI00380C7E72